MSLNIDPQQRPETGSVFEIELDVQGAQVGMQTGILDWHHIGVGTRLVDVLMPVAGWCYERSTLHPVHADSVFDRAVRIQFRSNQGIYAGLGFYREIMNTDAQKYGGTNFGNLGGVHAEAIPWNNKPYSIHIRMPALGVIYFKHERW